MKTIALMNYSLAFTIATSIITTVFIAGGFYVLTNWRISKLEEDQKNNNEVKDRLIAMETKIDMLLKDHKN